MAIFVGEIQNRYGIKQSTAYKWRKWLIENNLEVTWENFDKINKREYNLSSEITITVKPEPIDTVVDEPEPQQQGELFGMSFQRLQELNAEAELEVEVKDKLRELHENRKRQEKAQALKSKAEEIQKMDLGKFSSLLSGIIGGAA